MDRTKSDNMHSVAIEHLVGGVNSPVRAFNSVHGNPIYFDKASGADVFMQILDSPNSDPSMTINGKSVQTMVPV